MLHIVEVKNKKMLKKFMQFPNKLYQNNEHYVPPILFDELSTESIRHANKEISDSVLYLAYRGKEIVGRIRGIINHFYNENKNTSDLRFNHFDFIDDFDVSRILFEKVITWGKSQKMTTVYGPLGVTDLDKQGLLVDGFDLDGMMITYYNFEYYLSHYEQLGLVKDCDWVEYQVYIPEKNIEKIEKVATYITKKSNYKIVKIANKKDVKHYLYKIFDVYNEAFAPLHGVTKLSKKQIDQTVKQYFSLIQLEYFTIVTDSNDQVLAFGLLGPSLSKALQKNQGKLFPFGFIPLLKALKHPKILDMYLVAVKPELQGKGLNSLLMLDLTKNCIKNNILYAETGPELEDNLKIQSFWKNYKANIVRRRRCYKADIV